MKNRKLLLVLVSLVLLLTVSLSGTVAFLNDTDEAVNVMTLGNVDIEQHEKDASGKPFVQSQPLYPAYYEDGDTNIIGALDKIITVENTGKSDAYVRTWIAFEAGKLTPADFNKIIHIELGDNGYTLSNPEIVTIEDVNYYVVCATYNEALAAGATSVPSLKRVYMDKQANNSDVAQFGDTYEILAFTQAVQTANMEHLTPDQALNASFGVDHPWMNGVSTLPTVVVKTADELRNALTAGGTTVVLGADIELDADETITIGAGKSARLDLAGHTLRGVSDQTGSNRNLIDVNGGTLTVNNGTINYKHTGEDMGWNNSTNLFNVTAGGVLNLNGVTAINDGGSSMAFVAHLNNWGEATLNVNNSLLKSTYVAVRVFNSGNDMNNVSIYDSTLIGSTNCFWVHNYTVADFGTQEKADHQKTLLNLDIQNGTNIFYGNIRYGFTDAEVDNVSAAVANEVIVASAGDLVAIANNGASYAGKTIKLIADIDLAGIEWNSITIFAPESPFTFDGQNHTISNMTVTSGADQGLFDNSVGTIKNVVIENANMKTDGRSAFVAGRHYGNIDNCHVKNSVIDDSYWAVGGIAGLYNSGNITNCSVTNSTIKSNGGIGGIVGVVNETSGARAVTDCSVKNSTIHNTGIYGNDYPAGGIVGMINADVTLNLDGSTVEGNTLVGSYVYDIIKP